MRLQKQIERVRSATANPYETNETRLELLNELLMLCRFAPADEATAGYQAALNLRDRLREESEFYNAYFTDLEEKRNDAAALSVQATLVLAQFETEMELSASSGKEILRN